MKLGMPELFRRNGWGEFSRWMRPLDWAEDRVISGHGTHLFELSIGQKTFRAVGPLLTLLKTPGLESPRLANLADASPAVVFVVGNSMHHVWSLAMDFQVARSTNSFTHLTRDLSIPGASSGTRINLSQNGVRLAFASGRSGQQNIWLKDLKTGHEIQVSPSSKQQSSPLLNENGTRVAFAVHEGNERRVIAVADPALRRTRNVCDDCGHLKSWSADEKQMLAIRSGVLLLISEETGKTRVLLKNPRFHPQEAVFSRDGRWVALVTGATGKQNLQGFIVPFQGTLAPEKDWIWITEARYNLALNWSPDGNMTLFFDQRDGFRCI